MVTPPDVPYRARVLYVLLRRSSDAQAGGDSVSDEVVVHRCAPQAKGVRHADAGAFFFVLGTKWFALGVKMFHRVRSAAKYKQELSPSDC